MADSKISQLTTLVTIDATDIIPVVDDVSGTPVTKKITAQALKNYFSDIGHADLNSGKGTNTHDQIDSHIASTSNPHSVTKSQVGLGNVDNTSDLNKPISTATQSALDAKANSLGVDDNYVTDAEKVKLSNLSGINTGDQAIPDQLSDLSEDATHRTVTDTEKATWNGKQDTLVSGNNIKTINGSSLLGSGNLTVGGISYTLVATLANDVATGANTTPVSLTDLVFNYEANSIYRIWFMGRISPGVNTTGCGFQFDLSSAVTSIDLSFYHQLANSGTLSGGHSIADDASVGVSSGTPATSTYPVIGNGLLRTGANTGTAQLRFRSETTAVTTAKAGLVLVVEKIA